MNSFRKEKVNSLIRELASKFILMEIKNEKMLITVTKVEASANLQNIKIFITAYPEEKENAALKYLKQKKYDWQKFLADNFKAKFLPSSEFLIDEGEKKRQRMEKLLK